MVRPCCQSKKRIYELYGREKKEGGLYEDSWAVVTGGSDGIGYAYCKKLAKEGYNICMISRDEKKINEKLK